MDTLALSGIKSVVLGLSTLMQFSVYGSGLGGVRDSRGRGQALIVPGSDRRVGASGRDDREGPYQFDEANAVSLHAAFVSTIRCDFSLAV